VTIDIAGNRHRPPGSADGGQFTGKVNAAPLGVLEDSSGDLTTQTPVRIDEQLAALYEQRFVAFSRADSARARADRIQSAIDRGSALPYQMERYRQDLEKLEREAAEQDLEAARLRGLMRPFEAEFTRRGGWTRAFLVTGGHLHRSTNCSTCNREGRATRFAWMTDYSGANEDEIVEAAGNRACTTCYPTAPVEVLGRPSKLLTPDEEEAAREREARDAERARKAAEKAAKAITNPDGTDLREPGSYGQVVRTLVTAERELTTALVLLLENERSPFENKAFADRQREWSQTLVTAIAAKKGLSEDEVLGAAKAKAAAKFKKEWRG